MIAENRTSYLKAAEVVLRTTARPMTSRELVVSAVSLGLISPDGRTPHKTMNARISENMKQNGSASIFMRTFHGQFALREWGGEVREFETKPRKLKPLEETILVVPRPALGDLISLDPNETFYSVSPLKLLHASKPMMRMQAEEDASVVQIIPLFQVFCGSRILTYKRTSRLPEARLHHMRSVNFGGHLRDIDRGPLLEQFQDEQAHILFYRELFEELRFKDKINSITYLAALYSQKDEFSLKHIGVCFRVVAEGENILSNEPGFHTDVRFVPIEDVRTDPEGYDEWTSLVLRSLGGKQ